MIHYSHKNPKQLLIAHQNKEDNINLNQNKQAERKEKHRNNLNSSISPLYRSIRYNSKKKKCLYPTRYNKYW
jgi:hypothetical protein